MIQLITGAFGLLTTTINAVSLGATAGMTYGLGRKYGRKICEFSDNMEGRVMNFFAQTPE
jgi:hypothetical protein